MGQERPAPPPAGRERTGGRDLPAPYEDPWTLLRRDLRAVLASLRLRVWELSRRNRQGDLPVPGFWPRRLGAWFWPLVLALLVVAAAALLLLALNARPALLGRETQGQVTPALPSPGELTAAPSPASTVAPAAEPGDGRVQAPEPAQPALPVPPADPAAQEPAASETEMPPADPLLAVLQTSGPDPLLQAVRRRPALACLQLELAPAFQALGPAERQRQAEAWRLEVLDLGYERLELVDGTGRLLGRTARVGSGMILLDATDAPDVA